jgi:site-specific DNA recombinase
MTKPAVKQPALKAALYARYSSDLQKDTSIEDQFGMLEKAAKRLGLQLDKRYYFADRAQTGTTLFDRPGLTRDLLGAASRNEFDAILVEATDRLSRSQADLFWLSDRFQFHNIKLFTQNGEVSDMQLTFDGHANADYIKKLAMRVKRGHDRAAEQGRIVSALAYGYNAVPGKPGARMINESEAAVVRRIFAEYAAGKMPRQIVAGLARDKIPSPSGAPFWSHQAIVGGNGKSGGLVRNRLYIGEYVKNRFYNVKNPSTGKRLRRRADESEVMVVKVPHLQIIDRALWDAVHTLRQARGVKKFGPGGYYSVRGTVQRKYHLLNGLIRCADCSGMMTIMASSRRGHRIGCSSAIYRKTCNHTKTYDLDKLSALAIDKMRSEFTNPDFLKERAKAKAQEFERLMKQQSDERRTVQKQLDRLNLQIKRLVDAIADSDKPVKELMETIKDKEIERAGLEERVRLLGAETNITAFHPANLTRFIKGIDHLCRKIQKNPKDPECRLAFANVIDRVIVHRTEKGEPYEISLYGRLSAITAVNLFPTGRPVEEIIATEGLPRIGPDGTVSSRPQSSRRSTGWSSR